MTSQSTTSVYPDLSSGGSHYADLNSSSSNTTVAYIKDGSVYVSVDQPSLERYHAKLSKVHKKLKKRNRVLFAILMGMIAFLTFSLIPLYVKMKPQMDEVFRKFFGRSPSSGISAAAVSGLADCTAGGSVDKCVSMINQIYGSQHTRLKQDEKEDDTLDDNLRKVLQILKDEADRRVIYRWRPGAHLDLNLAASLDGKYCDQTGNWRPLVWKEPVEGAPLRGMELDTKTGALKVKHPGYYFVYSHVTYNITVIANSTNRQVFGIFKNFGPSSSQRKLLESVALPSNMDNSVMIQGIFFLHENDTLAVCAHTGSIHAERTAYFGAFLI